MSSKLIAIIGPSGSGKSTSIRTLNPDETFIINVARKELPFRGAEKLYNVEKKNYVEVDDIKQITTYLQQISTSAPQIKNIVMDDAIYSMAFNMVRKATETGFVKFSLLLQDVTTMLTTARRLRNDLKVFYLSHSETIQDGEKIIGHKIKTVGKALDNQIVLEGLFTICLYTHIDEDSDGNPTFNFVTNRYHMYPAKSPMGMFEQTLIPNDLANVCKIVDDYYAEDVTPVTPEPTKKSTNK